MCLLSAGVHSSAIVHALAVVDLKPTQVGKDALAAIGNVSPRSYRQKIVIKSLTADSSTNTIFGVALETYKVPIVGTVTATIQFKTNIDTPKAGDVKASVNKFGSLLTASRKKTIQNGVVQFLKKEHQLIVNALANG
jgi:hypothetical protein